MTGSSQAKPGSGYVSPYPPLPNTNAPSPARPTPTVGGAHSASRQAQPIPPAAALTSREESETAQKLALIEALTEHRINTLRELRRVERQFATLGSSDLTQPMTSAWMYYVNSNNLLTELRNLTRNYPFSSECLDEAKRRVYQDPASNRSWNFCWLVLAKIHTAGLVPTYARSQALKPEMWGGRVPDPDSVERLAAAFRQEWNGALAQLLRLWETPPIRD